MKHIIVWPKFIAVVAKQRRLARKALSINKSPNKNLKKSNANGAKFSNSYTL